LAYALKWCRNASNFLAAAQAVSAHHLYSSVVLLAYASAFHSLHAYLSVHGCVFVDPAHDEDDSTELRRTVVARLTKGGTWKFEGARRGHQLRWNELKHLWRHSSVPHAFRELFGYFYSDRWKVAPTLDWLVAKSGGKRSAHEPVRWQFEEKVDEFLGEIADVRHEAQYMGFGADPSAWDAMINDKYGTTRYPLHLRAEATTSFAVSLAEDVASILTEALQSVKVSKRALDGFRLLTFFPVQDSWRSAARAGMFTTSGIGSNGWRSWPSREYGNGQCFSTSNWTR
jgi:HEPN domain